MRVVSTQMRNEGCLKIDRTSILTLFRGKALERHMYQSCTYMQWFDISKLFGETRTGVIKNDWNLSYPCLEWIKCKISLCHQYKAMPAYTSVQSDQALQCWLWPISSLHLDFPINDNGLRAKNGKWIIPFKKFRKV